MSYDPDGTTTSHILPYNPGIPTVHKNHDGKLATLVSTCGLVDPLALQHSTRPIPPSHIRGSERIDFILITPNLMPAVLSSGCLSSHAVFNSDHRAYFVDFDSHLLFSDPAYEIERPRYRQLRLHDPKLIQRYCNALHEQIEIHKVLHKIETLQKVIDNGSWQETHTTEYQQLDDIVTELMLQAE
jgi:hypothetical protein